MEVKLNTLTPEVFLLLYQSVGWEAPCVEQVRIALECYVTIHMRLLLV